MAPATGKSGSEVEQLGDEGRLGPYVASAHPPYLPLSHHCHPLVACQGSSRRPEAAEAKPRSDQAFQAPVVLFHNVIESALNNPVRLGGLSLGDGLAGQLR